MKQLLLIFMLFLFCDSLMSQTIERIEVNGIILAENEDVENVTIYNTSSNKGTITNKKGEFVIKVGVNDIVEVSALQFNAVKITITKDVLTTKRLKIYLTEHINQLDAVLLSSGLTGNLVTDIDDAEELPALELDLGNMNALEFFDDKVHSIMMLLVIELNRAGIVNKGGLYNGIDFARIFGLNKLLRKKKNESKPPKAGKEKDLLDVYSHKYISDTFNIPIEKVELFIAFIDKNGMNFELLEDENEVYLIDFLIKQSKAFLKLKDAKN